EVGRSGGPFWADLTTCRSRLEPIRRPDCRRSEDQEAPFVRISRCADLVSGRSDGRIAGGPKIRRRLLYGSHDVQISSRADPTAGLQEVRRSGGAFCTDLT